MFFSNALRTVMAVFLAFAICLLPAPRAFAQMGGGGDMGGGKGGSGKGGGGRRSGGGRPQDAQHKDGPRGPAPGGEFNGAAFTCLEYTNGAGEASTSKLQATFARLWIEGNLAGFYKAQNRLTLSNDDAARALLTERIFNSCLRSPAASVMVVGLQALGAEDLKLPNALIGDLALDTYTCRQHLAAKSGTAGDAVKSDVAEMWAFAFIQGYKLARNAELTIPIQSKPILVNALLKNCAGNPEMVLLDLAATIAEKVKLQ